MPGSSSQLLRHSRPDGEPEPLLEEGRDLGGHVLVARIGLHRPRRAEHVHQAEIGARLADRVDELGVAAERGDVVDHLGAEGERPPGHGRLGRVDRDRQLAADGVQHRLDAPELLVGGHALGAGPRRFTADVHDRRAVGDRAAARCDRVLRARFAPPSEKESGVTLTTPITEGAGKRSSSGGLTPPA